MFKTQREFVNECREDGTYLWPITMVGMDGSSSSGEATKGGHDGDHHNGKRRRTGAADASISTGAKIVLLAARWNYTPGIEADVNFTIQWGFQVIGTTVIVVDNAEEEPDRWQYRMRVRERRRRWWLWWWEEGEKVVVVGWKKKKKKKKKKNQKKY